MLTNFLPPPNLYEIMRIFSSSIIKYIPDWLVNEEKLPSSTISPNWNLNAIVPAPSSHI